MLPRVHVRKRVANDILEERTSVNLSKYKPKRVRTRVTEHDKFETRHRFVQMQLVRRGAVIDKMVVSVVKKD